MAPAMGRFSSSPILIQGLCFGHSRSRQGIWSSNLGVLDALAPGKAGHCRDFAAEYRSDAVAAPDVERRQVGRGVDGIDRFTIPRKPYRRVLEKLPQFVTVKGGAYFFMPGIAALRFVAQSCRAERALKTPASAEDPPMV